MRRARTGAGTASPARPSRSIAPAAGSLVLLRVLLRRALWRPRRRAPSCARAPGPRRGGGAAPSDPGGAGIGGSSAAAAASAGPAIGSSASPSWWTRWTGLGSDSLYGSIASGSLPSSSSWSMWRRRVPRSIESSRWTWRSGMRLIRSVRPSSWRMNPIECWSARSVSFWSALPPMMLTQTFACRRSGAVSTSVIVTNPIRGSAISCASRTPISWRRSSSTRSVRWLIVVLRPRGGDGCRRSPPGGPSRRSGCGPASCSTR